MTRSECKFKKERFLILKVDLLDFRKRTRHLWHITGNGNRLDGNVNAEWPHLNVKYSIKYLRGISNILKTHFFDMASWEEFKILMFKIPTF